MRISIYEFLALFSLFAAGCAAGWCFKGVWDKEVDYIRAEKRLCPDEEEGEL